VVGWGGGFEHLKAAVVRIQREDGPAATEEFAGVSAFAAGDVEGEAVVAGAEEVERAEEGVAGWFVVDGLEVGGPVALVVG
jgi:hypothetical protein